MPLPDGTNAEGEDLGSPLPSSWTDKNKLKVVLYGTHGSPATCRTRALLELAGISYQRKFGKASGSDYRKYPVVFAGYDNDDSTKTRQINDSHIIFKHLAPILFRDHYATTNDKNNGTSLEGPTKRDLELDREAAFGLMLSCEIRAFGSPACIKQWAKTVGLNTGLTGLTIRNFLPLSKGQMASSMIAKKHPTLKSPVEYCREFQKELEKRSSPFFSGNEPGPLDASLYGTIAVWAPNAVGSGDKNMPFMEEALKESGLDVWYGRMCNDVMPSTAMWEYKGIWPLYT